MFEWFKRTRNKFITLAVAGVAVAALGPSIAGQMASRIVGLVLFTIGVTGSIQEARIEQCKKEAQIALDNAKSAEQQQKKMAENAKDLHQETVNNLEHTKSTTEEMNLLKECSSKTSHIKSTTSDICIEMQLVEVQQDLADDSSVMPNKKTEKTMLLETMKEDLTGIATNIQRFGSVVFKPSLDKPLINDANNTDASSSAEPIMKPKM